MPLSDTASGALRAGTAMTMLGCSTAVSAAFAGYPLLGGQAVRYLLAAVLLVPVALRSGPRGVRPTRRELGRLALVAATGLFAFNVLLVQAVRHSGPAAVGSVVGASPLLLAVLGPALVRRRPHGRTVAAAVVVAAGAAVAQGLGGGGAAGTWYALGTLGCEAAFSLLAVPLLPRLGPVGVSAWVTVLAVPMFAVTAAVRDGRAALRAPTGAELAALLYLAVVMTVVAFLLWYGALGRLGPERAGLFAGLVPITSALAAAVLGTGAPRAGEVAGALLVGAGVVLGVRGPSRTAAPAPDPAQDSAQAQAQADGPERARAAAPAVP
ncbi:DMT family transporter [Kitasatospora sp. NBC_01539]|uniref:DMT family transporter n=1 Tax=Kitasatospora sp. NBC_01539 TaxID=2903577 RepID=UPI0038602431